MVLIMTDTCNAGHIFRSKLLDRFATIESWAVSMLATGKQPSPNAPLGQKVDALAKLCAKSPPMFKSAKKIGERLERLKPYQDLRSSIVHSQMETVTSAESEVLLCFRNVAQTQAPARFRPVLLATKDCDDILREVGKIYNELKQMTAATPNPPSPPQP